MSNIDDAADQVIGLAEKLRGIIALADVIKSIGSIDQAISERKAALDNATATTATAQGLLADVQAAIVNARKDQQEKLAQHQQECDAYSQRATMDAAEIVRQARAQAADLTAAAQEAMDASNQTHVNLIAEKQSRLTDLQKSIEKAEQGLATISASYDETAARVDALKVAAKSVLATV